MKDFQFIDWREMNINHFKKEFKVPINVKLRFTCYELTKLLEDIPAAAVNPLITDGQGMLSWHFTEWLAEYSVYYADKHQAILNAARFFSWDFPQIKMVIHSVEEFKPENNEEFYAKNYTFVVEFLT